MVKQIKRHTKGFTKKFYTGYRDTGYGEFCRLGIVKGAEGEGFLLFPLMSQSS